MKQLSLLLLFVFTVGASAAGIVDRYPDTDGVYLVKGEAQKKAINKMLEDVDLAFEMGDGYYSVIHLVLYVVRDGSKVKGYIEKYKMSYTEDREYVTVLVRYDKNGKRVGDYEITDSEPMYKVK